jgi:thioredoxin-related protein
MSMISRRTLLLATAIALPATAACAGEARLELVMFERPGCPWCVRWMKDIGASYGDTPEAKIAPLRVVDLWATPTHGLTLKEPVRFTPTFVVLSDGVEIGRITGYIDNASFWGLYGKLLESAAPARDKPEPA